MANGYRMTYNMWKYLKKFLHDRNRKSLRRLLNLPINSYFWHDSFGKYWHRWVTCPLLGHGNVQIIMQGDVFIDYCFDCERTIRWVIMDK